MSQSHGRASGRAVLLDKVLGPDFPSTASPADVLALERIPIEERLAAASTYEAIGLAATHYPDAPALQFLPNASPEDLPHSISYRAFFAGVTQTANMFHHLEVGPRDVVSFLLPLLPQSFMTLYGAQAAGIANPVNPLLEPAQIAEILEAAGTKVLVALGPMAGSDIWDKVTKISPRLSHLRTIIKVGGGPVGAPNVVDFDDLVAQQPADRLLSGRNLTSSDVAAYFHTGGTTGTPKLVVHTHLNQVFQAWACNLMLRSPPLRNLLFGMPLFHVGGSLTQALATFSAGGCLVVLSPAGWRNPSAVKNIWQLIARYRPDVFSSVPTVLAAAMTVPIAGADISSLRYSAGGGSAIPVAVGDTIQKTLGIPVLEVYGMTETSSVHTIAYMDRPVRLGSVGHPVPYARVRVVKLDDSGRLLGDCGPNEIGVVAMAGPGVFGGYLNAEHNRNAFVEPGWVNSGDLGRLDEDGYLWITGRAKDVVIRGGHNIDPAPIEDVLFQHPAVALAAVVGQPDAYAGELPIAFVQLKPGARVEPGELEAWTRERTPERAAVPVRIVVVDPMPLTAVGKVFKPKLRWDAGQKVFQEALAELQREGIDVEVAVGPHGTHGSIATVTIAGVAEGARGALLKRIGERLDPFVMRHEVVWR